MLQLISAIIFFYVFGLGGILMTYFAVKIIIQLIQESQGRTHRLGGSSSEVESDNNVRLHISEGLIQVNRIPGEKEEEN